MYQLREGQLAYIFHRVSGLAIVLFLFAHIVENFFLLMGEDAYNAAIGIYHTWYFRLGEFALIAAVVYHGLNGLRIIAIDFWQDSTKYHKQMWYAVLLVSAAIMLWVGYVLLWQYDGWPWMDAMAHGVNGTEGHQ